MSTAKNILLTAVASFAGGYVAGLLSAPGSGRSNREAVARMTRSRISWLEGQLSDMERKLAQLESDLVAKGSDLGHRVKEATGRLVDTYVETVPDDPSKWEVEGKELTRDLRRMPRK